MPRRLRLLAHVQLHPISRFGPPSVLERQHQARDHNPTSKLKTTLKDVVLLCHYWHPR